MRVRLISGALLLFVWFMHHHAQMEDWQFCILRASQFSRLQSQYSTKVLP